MLTTFPKGKSTVELPCSVVAVTAKAGERQGAMTACAMYVSQAPPLILISISKEFATYELIEKAKEFAINILADNQIDLARKLGTVHGKNVDKLAETKTPMDAAERVKAPLIRGCFAYIECKVKASFSDVEGDHAVYVGEVESFKMDKDLKPLVWWENKYFKVGNECKL